MTTTLFRPPPPPPNFQGDPYARGGLRVWDDYQFRRKGIKSGGGPPVPIVPPIIATPPVNIILPTADGLTSVGQSLVCTEGIWSGTLPINYAYQWYWLAEVVLPTAPINTIAPTADDFTEEGQIITCARGTWTGTAPISYEYQWFWFFVETPTAPSNSTPPHASGSPYPARVLTCTTGSWIGTAPIIYHYQWKSGTTNVGTDSPSYFTVVGDLSALITCMVTATNIVSSATVTSNAIGPIVEAPPSEPLLDEEGDILLDEDGEELTT